LEIEVESTYTILLVKEKI